MHVLLSHERTGSFASDQGKTMKRNTRNLSPPGASQSPAGCSDRYPWRRTCERPSSREHPTRSSSCGRNPRRTRCRRTRLRSPTLPSPLARAAQPTGPRWQSSVWSFHATELRNKVSTGRLHPSLRGTAHRAVKAHLRKTIGFLTVEVKMTQRTQYPRRYLFL